LVEIISVKGGRHVIRGPRRGVDRALVFDVKAPTGLIAFTVRLTPPGRPHGTSADIFSSRSGNIFCLLDNHTLGN
jgi:hypothetical protein